MDLHSAPIQLVEGNGQEKLNRPSRSSSGRGAGTPAEEKDEGIWGMMWLGWVLAALGFALRSEEHTSELQSLMRISYAVFCLKKKKTITQPSSYHTAYEK